jgi:hypothetical protein
MRSHAARNDKKEQVRGESDGLGSTPAALRIRPWPAAIAACGGLLVVPPCFIRYRREVPCSSGTDMWRTGTGRYRRFTAPLAHAVEIDWWFARKLLACPADRSARAGHRGSVTLAVIRAAAWRPGSDHLRDLGGAGDVEAAAATCAFSSPVHTRGRCHGAVPGRSKTRTWAWSYPGPAGVLPVLTRTRSSRRVKISLSVPPSCQPADVSGRPGGAAIPRPRRRRRGPAAG